MCWAGDCGILLAWWTDGAGVVGMVDRWLCCSWYGGQVVVVYSWWSGQVTEFTVDMMDRRLKCTIDTMDR